MWKIRILLNPVEVTKYNFEKAQGSPIQWKSLCLGCFRDNRKFILYVTFFKFHQQLPNKLPSEF